MDVSWSDRLLAILHDPPDKALSIRGHVPRARDNAKIALGDNELSRRQLEDNVTSADPLASLVERLPMPKAGPDGERTVGPVDGRLRVFHPLSAEPAFLGVPGLDDDLIAWERGNLEQLVGDLPNDDKDGIRNRFLAIWRLWPESLAAGDRSFFARLPADTRTPDHTIWHHLDVTAAFKVAEADGQGAALLALAVGPVQSFIEAARSVRDLWSGSMILSWLAFRGFLPVVERLGPTALIYPALRGIPLLDLWLCHPDRLAGKIAPPGDELRLTPSLPNRFVALVPWGRDGAAARDLARECREAVAAAWSELATTVKERIQGPLDAVDRGWDRRWTGQVAGYFDTTAAMVPLVRPGREAEVDRRLADLLTGHESFAAAFPHAEAVRNLARAIPQADCQGYDQDHSGRWQYQVELVNRSLAARRSIRHVPVNPLHPSPDGPFPQKCTLLGTLEQVGPDDLRTSKDIFWKRISDRDDGLSIDGVRVRKGESLCAVALVKRFAGPAFLARELGVEPSHLRFPDTWTVAAAGWLEEAGINWRAECGEEHGRPIPWNGQWLHWPQADHDLDEADPCPLPLFARIKDAHRTEKLGYPPVYYAILKLDGDELGDWLRGEKSPRVGDVMHPDLVRYYRSLGDAARGGLEVRRPVGPALHAAISTALANFALHAVPSIVDRYHGTTIYSGGDDTLVLLPANQALACALALREAYMSEYFRSDGRDYLMMGRTATLSGGLVVVHAKDDLRLALKDARRDEDRAKEAGRDRLVISVRRRSGEHTSAVCPWSFASTVDRWAERFREGASDRWAYHLSAERSSLERLPAEAIKAEIRRRVARSEEPTPTLLTPDGMAGAFESYAVPFETMGAALEGFLTLCQTASFLARGRDR